MAGIVFDKFDNGLDIRRGAATSDANRMRVLRNAYVTTGKEIKKRPGLTKIAVLEPGTIGLESGLGKLNTFYESGTISHANQMFKAWKVAHSTPGSTAAKRCWYCDAFNGYLYVAIEYTDGSVLHHYLDKGQPPTAATYIADANCPHGKGVTKTASKIFSTKGSYPYDTVRFCATNNVRDWTTSGDAGFIPVGLKQENAQNCYALGQFRDKLACFFQDAVQLWTVDTNPVNNTLEQKIFGVGTRYPMSPASFADDVFFLADQGVRSITVNQMTANLQDTDIGSPIDQIVRKSIGNSNPVSMYVPSFGQYWLILGDVVYAYSFSRASKLAAWSEYKFPFVIEAAAVLDNVLYIRNGDDVYKFDEDAYTDNGTTIDVEILMPYLDFKMPGVLKMITGMDIVLEGAATVSMLVDPNNRGAETIPMTIYGDTRPGPLIPIEVCATAIAPRIRHALNEPLKLTAISFFYERLGI